MHSYCVSGLSVNSEIMLPGLVAAAAGDRPDVTILLDTVPLALTNVDASGPTWQMAADRFLLRIPDVARFLLTNGDQIAVEAENGTPLEDVTIFLVGTVLGVLLHQREQIALHASGVWVNGKAVLFCGASGAGKSTLAAALVQRGYPLVTDDLCAIALDDTGRPTVQPDGRQLKLWAHAIANLDLAESRGAAVRNRLEKYYVDPGDAAVGPLPLGAVYALRDARPPHKSGIEQPNVVDAAVLLRCNAYRPQLVNRMGQKANYFHAATAIANAAGIFHLTRPLNFDAMPQVIAQLERHWSQIDLMEPAA